MTFRKLTQKIIIKKITICLKTLRKKKTKHLYNNKT